MPPDPFRDPALTRRNPAITVRVTPQGGHCAFVERADGSYDGYWAERETSVCDGGSPPEAEDEARIRRLPNSGPFPSSSCLKYTKTSLHARLLRNHRRPTARCRRPCSPRRAAGSSRSRRVISTRSRQLLAVGHAQRQVACAQPVEHVVVEPRRVPELERRAHLEAETCRETRRRARDPSSDSAAAETERAQLGAERAAACQKAAPIAAVAQPRDRG